MFDIAFFVSLFTVFSYLADSSKKPWYCMLIMFKICRTKVFFWRFKLYRNKIWIPQLFRIKLQTKRLRYRKKKLVKIAKVSVNQASSVFNPFKKINLSFTSLYVPESDEETSPAQVWNSTAGSGVTYPIWNEKVKLYYLNVCTFISLFISIFKKNILEKFIE